MGFVAQGRVVEGHGVAFFYWTKTFEKTGFRQKLNFGEQFVPTGHTMIYAFSLSSSITEAYLNHLYSVQFITTSFRYL